MTRWRTTLALAVFALAATAWFALVERPRMGAEFTFSRSSLMLSTPVFEAPSISITSNETPSRISTQFRQTPQGFSVGPLTQFRALASTRAAVVLPMPRMPVNRNAWWIRPDVSALRSVVTTCSWPTMSENVWGRHLRAMT